MKSEKPIVIQRTEYTPAEQIYLVEILRGMGITLRHFLKNLWGVLSQKRAQPTWEYPEEPREYLERHRLVHRLTQRPDGTPKCVACYMCATACPADCIQIVAEESLDPNIEKRPKTFVIDELVCIFCGFCVEACPKDAIRMDTEIGDWVGTSREDFVLDMETLMSMKPRKNTTLEDLELAAKMKAKEQAG